MLGTAGAEAPPPRVAPLPSAIPFHPAGFSRHALGARGSPAAGVPQGTGSLSAPHPISGDIWVPGALGERQRGGTPVVVSVLGQGEQRGRALPGVFCGGKLG